MKHSRKSAIVATLLLATVGATTPMATAQNSPSPEVQKEINKVEQERHADQHAVVPVKTKEKTAVRTADGVTAAPGGNGAFVGIYVQGSHRHVDNVSVNYFPGTEIAGKNPSAESFELAWYEGGQRRAETQETKSGFITAGRSWKFNRDIDAGPMCGRVKLNGQWTNYACVDIKP